MSNYLVCFTVIYQISQGDGALQLPLLPVVLRRKQRKEP